MLLHFTGTCLTVQARKSFDPATNAYEGRGDRVRGVKGHEPEAHLKGELSAQSD